MMLRTRTFIAATLAALTLPGGAAWAQGSSRNAAAAQHPYAVAPQGASYSPVESAYPSPYAQPQADQFQMQMAMRQRMMAEHHWRQAMAARQAAARQATPSGGWDNAPVTPVSATTRQRPTTHTVYKTDKPEGEKKAEAAKGKPEDGKKPAVTKTQAEVIIESPSAASPSVIATSPSPAPARVPVLWGLDGNEFSPQPPRNAMYFLIEGMALRREGLGLQAVSSVLPQAGIGNLGTIGRKLTTKDLSFEHDAALQFLIGYQFANMDALELSYYGLPEWSDEQVLTNQSVGVDALFSPYLQFVTGIGTESSHTMKYYSQVHNAEINLRRTLVVDGGWLAAATAGFRYFRYSDRFELLGEDNITDIDERTRIRAFNNLIGIQTGGELQRNYDAITVGMWGKGGVLANVATQKTDNFLRLPGTQDEVERLHASGNDTGVSGLLEGGVRLGIRVYEGVRLTAGYQWVFISNLAAASNQLPNLDPGINFIAGPPGQGAPPKTGAGIDTDGSMLLHGPAFGAEITWGGPGS